MWPCCLHLNTAFKPCKLGHRLGCWANIAIKCHGLLAHNGMHEKQAGAPVRVLHHPCHCKRSLEQLWTAMYGLASTSTWHSSPVCWATDLVSKPNLPSSVMPPWHKLLCLGIEEGAMRVLSHPCHCSRGLQQLWFTKCGLASTSTWNSSPSKLGHRLG